MARILVAEDDPDIRHLITQLLIDDGHEVAAVPNGVQAVEKLLERPPDVLVLDIMMPGKDGYQVLEELSDYVMDSSVKVLVLSARTAEHDYERSATLGAYRHLTKPFDPEELLNTVTELLALSKEEVTERRERERDRAYLLSQLESIFSDD
jgi:DNA-binding response OmpR family regulator